MTTIDERCESGHEVWGKGGHGYPILLTLGLRPVLIVIGFVVGIAMNWVGGHLINVTFLAASNIQNMEPNGILGNLSQFAGAIVVFSGLHMFSAYKSFSLTHELPNAILRWMGVSDHADLGERESKDMALAVGMGGARGMGSSGFKGKGKVGKEKETKDEDPDKKGDDTADTGGEVDPSVGNATKR